jgi:hypothetical protein
MIVSLFSDINYEGTCQTFSRANPDLRNSILGNDIASSIRIGAQCPGFAGRNACLQCKKAWQRLPGLAMDVGAGANGSVWVIGTDPVGTGQDFGVHRWTGSTWENIDGGGVRIDVDERGNPWLINSAGEIFQRVGDGWEKRPGLARDIGIGADGSVWIIGTNRIGIDPFQHNFGIWRWTGSDWESIDGGGVQISVDKDGVPWVVNFSGQIFIRP